ncbi:unnamed protein product [Clonostachys rosea]|uniref:Transcription factor domain-containing protein n=1 Tax=Bionectria ochroleuca TaxID=29856 RepID=A0ABY6UAW5_BIOOC|nr:unnamed protein product [Clonostachys rosea]
MYEFTECPGRTTDAYMRHINGLMEIIRVRGPEVHTEGLAHGIFQVLRAHGIFHGLHRRRVTFLSQPEWLSVPWGSSFKDPHDLLVDIFLEIPSVVHSIDILKSKMDNPSEETEHGWDIVANCLRIDASLKNWLSDYSAASAGPLYWPELSTIASETDSERTGKLFPVAFNFPSFGVGETMVLYWTVCVLLHSYHALVYRKLLAVQEKSCYQTGAGDDRNSSSNDIIRQLECQQDSLETSARCICQSVHYFCGDARRNIGSSTILPSLVVLRAIFLHAPGDWSRAEAWVGEKLSQIQGMGNDYVAFI